MVLENKIKELGGQSVTKPDEKKDEASTLKEWRPSKGGQKKTRESSSKRDSSANNNTRKTPARANEKAVAFTEQSSVNMDSEQS